MRGLHVVKARVGRLPVAAVVAVAVALALLSWGIQPLLTQGSSKDRGRANADTSVVRIDRKEVQAGAAMSTVPSGTDGKRLAQVKAARVAWPAAGSGTLTVPARGKTAGVKKTAVSVTAPSAKAAKLLKTDEPAPQRVKLTAYGPAKARQLGGHATAFSVLPAAEKTGDKAAQGPVGIRVDVSGFADAFGGDFESRLALMAKPACALRTPDKNGCSTGELVPGHIDLTRHTLVADVTADPDTAYVVIAQASSETGSATATKLASSSKWSVGLQSGDFSWSLPLPQVPALAGDAPDISLGYSSQAVDGMVAAENNQPSWVGQGWDLALPFIERRYHGCTDDGGDTGDLCWAGDELQLSLKGTSSPLVKDTAAGGDSWRAKEDPGWRVQRKKGADNGDDDGEYWVVTTPQGTQYTFGRGKQATSGTDTHSVYTVPVFGDDEGEPCHKSSVEDSWCTQAWRWNLDGVVDAHGNSNTYFYTQETNHYARNGDTDKSTEYVRGGHLADIVYSQRSGAEDQQAPARLHFTTGLRCTEAVDGSGSCPAFDEDHASSYPDAPLDSLCTDRCTGEEQKSPTFFTGALLRSVTAQRSGADGGWTDVDRLDLTYAYPKPSDGTSAGLWLEKVQQTGLSGSGELKLPAVEFTGKELANRADADPAAGAPEMRKLRITSVVDELGRRVDVGYGQPDPCPVDNLPEGRYDSNTQDCFPGWRTNGTDSGFGVWQKYLTTKVTVRDTAGGAPAQVTEYRYQGTPAWHHDDDPVTKAERKSWSDWRGYGSVDVAKMTDPGYRGEDTSRAAQITRTLYFRGMDGDSKADGSTKSVEVTDSQGTSLKDLPYLRAKERESRQFQVSSAGEATYELGGTIHGYTSAHTTPAKDGETSAENDAHLIVEDDSVNRETVLSDSGDRSTSTTRLRTTYDTYGQATSVEDTAGDDVRCTKTSYDRSAATVDSWTVAFPYRVRSYAGSCADPKSLISGKDQYYDGSTQLGGAVSKGDVTRTVSAVSASAPDTVTVSVTTEAGFDAYGRTISETDGRGNTDRTAYDPSAGRPTTVTETNVLGQAEVTTLEPDRQLPVAVKDANGQSTRNRYDALGRITAVSEPDQSDDDPPSQVFSYFLDPEHTKPPLVTTKQLQSGDTYVTTRDYLDSLGRDRQSQTVSPASTSDAPKTIVTDKRYDDVGNQAAESLPVVAPGEAGSALLAVPADQVDETRYAYDAIGRTTRSTQFGSGKELWHTSVEYFGDHERTTPPAGGVVTTSWTDAREREVRKQDGTPGPGQVTTSFTYTPADQVATTTDPDGHQATYEYDLLGRRTAADDPDSGKSRTRFDANGNQTASWDAKAIAAGSAEPTQSTDFDKANRPTTRWEGASGSGKKIASWTYDSTSVPNGIGQVASQTTHDGGKDYTQAVTGYDPRGRVTGKAYTFPAGLGGTLHDKTYTVNYRYDAADHVTEVSYPDDVIGTPSEKLTTAYDTLGNPQTLTGTTKDPLTGKDRTRTYISATGYAADGKLASRDYADPHHDLRRVYGYEEDSHRLSRIQTLVDEPLGDGMEAKQDDTYRWDPAGNLTSITDTSLHTPVATCYTYDGLARLGHAWTTEKTDCSDSASTLTHDGPAGYNKSWTYSADGDITSTRSLLETRDYTYGDAAHPHAVTEAGHDSYAYDANGALQKKSEGLVGDIVPSDYEWNAQHQLTEVTSKLVAKTKFVYAPDGSRMARVDPAGVATLYIDGQEITVALGIAKGTRYYRIAGTTVAARLPLGVLKWQLSDNQGSTQVTVPEGTGLVERTYYDPYGDIRALSAPPPTDHGWLGKVKDPTTGLNALGARYYDSSLGRFISTDPAYDPTSAQTANAYSYGANNPVMFTDPTGLWSLGGVWDGIKKGASAAWDWASENKGLIANVVVGIGVGIAVGAVCATGVGCLILAGAAAGAAGAAAGYGTDVVEGKQEFSWGGLASNMAFGAATGALTAGALAGAGAAGRAALDTAAGKALSAGASKVTSAVTGAASNGGRALANVARAAGSKLAPAAKAVTKPVADAARNATNKTLDALAKRFAPQTIRGTTARLQGYVDKAVSDYASGAIRMSARQARAAASNPNLTETFRGQVLDRAVKTAAQNDPKLGHLWISRSGEFGPDFHDIMTSTWWDVTTRAAWNAHVRLYQNPFGRGIGLFTG
jgi:RHS repeat-associated protein